MKISKIIGISALAMASVALLAACGNSKSDNKSSDGKSVKTVNVAISASSNPYEYTDANGKMTGFEYDILQKAAANLPQYKFVYKNYQDDSLLTQIDAGRADIAANNFGKTQAREEKYLFSYPTLEGVNAIFSSSKNNFKKISELGGSNTTIPTGTNYGDILSKWNTENPKNKITINYSQNTLVERLQDVASGKIGFLFAAKSAAENLIKEHAINGVVDNIPSDLGDYSYFKTYEYFILAQNDSQLQKDLNAQIKKMEEDGTLKKLSEKYFKADHVPAADQFK
ncbi:transporter substrate-binding domain-containing protein [Lactococcus termiticola]|nr:transporter substrate-binding domain-containing protein [Lactococcus termiticola]